MARCRSCDAEIRWLKTKAGKAMPVDRPIPDESATVFEYGVHVPHFTTCPNANRHRKPKAQKEAPKPDYDSGEHQQRATDGDHTENSYEEFRREMAAQKISPPETLHDYWRRLSRHDWFYERSDSSNRVKKGQDEQAAIKLLAGNSQQHQDLYNAFVEYINGRGEKPAEPITNN